MHNLLIDLRWLAGFVLVLSGWYLSRRAARTPLRLSAALTIDSVLPAIIFTLVLALSARPLLAGVVTFALGAGWGKADRDKRSVLGEPIVYTDIFQAFDILRHPKLALPFPHKSRILLAAIAVITFLALIVHFEPAVWSGVWLPLVLCVAGIACVIAIGSSLLPQQAADLRGLRLTGDPNWDAAAYGPFATILLHGFFARSERAQRNASAAPTAAHATFAGADGPVVLVQNESFFDVRRLQPGLLPELLPNFDRCCREGVQWGRLLVPCWGANTVRTEFAVLSGLNSDRLGFDRFNPYHRFVNRPIASLAWKLRSEGYHTVCLHPFDRHFYRRDHVMLLLGFSEFLGEERFTDAERCNGYVSDAAVARVAAQILHECGPKVFLFIITMENHGPWSGATHVERAELSQLPLLHDEQLVLDRYTESLTHADAMLGCLRAELEAQKHAAVLGFYGDHLPSFPTIFSKLGLKSPHSDYLIWHPGRRTGVAQDLTADELGNALLNARRSSVHARQKPEREVAAAKARVA
jgi:phosphoglycerol transferase MdoB-like AlkP superfamily enzyme